MNNSSHKASSNNRFIFLICIMIPGILLMGFTANTWGFFGHRRINRMAVFTLPPSVIPLFKKNIEYITEHSVDPDKRRYAVPEEAVRHYIDIDHWDVYPFEKVPRTFEEAVLQYGYLYFLPENGDTIDLIKPGSIDFRIEKDIENQYLNTNFVELLDFVSNYIMEDFHLESHYFELAEFKSSGLSLTIDLPGQIVFENQFDDYGILPYHLLRIQKYLTKAFEQKNKEEILRLSADIGHYIADAHVPLHTSENYNGQLTNQEGIHAFWESRLPELFADDSYDYFVGKAQYIDDPSSFYWNSILESHAMLDSVLAIERALSISYPSDQQFCFEDRGNYTIRTQCESYSEAYHIAMDGMVESRMRDAISAVGSVWFTAWVDAGQPDLRNLSSKIELSEEEKKRLEEQEKQYRQGNIKGRKHDH